MPGMPATGMPLQGMPGGPPMGGHMAGPMGGPMGGGPIQGGYAPYGGGYQGGFGGAPPAANDPMWGYFTAIAGQVGVRHMLPEFCYDSHVFHCTLCLMFKPGQKETNPPIFHKTRV